MWRCLGNVCVLLHVRANGDCAVSLGVRESAGYTRTVVVCVGGWKAWPIGVLDTRTRARMNVRPRHLVELTGKKERESGKKKIW